MSPFGLSCSIAIFFLAVILHECAHGWVAYRLGDPTAKLLGRLTLNPVKHIDPVGTVILPAMLFLIHSPILFGWAKPVPVNFSNLRNPKRDMIWVGLAGPFVNVILAVFCSRLLQFNFSDLANGLLELAITVNLLLAVFNMIPIPPLDGSRLVLGLLPNRYAFAYSRLEPYGIILVFFLLYFGVIEKLLWPVVVSWSQLLGVRT